jgi:hypothetical protein
MPFSYDTFDHWISAMVGLLQPATVCDIGPGACKYGRITKERTAKDGFTSQVDRPIKRGGFGRGAQCLRAQHGKG